MYAYAEKKKNCRTTNVTRDEMSKCVPAGILAMLILSQCTIKVGGRVAIGNAPVKLHPP